jgi:hypothetical protein
MKMMKMAYQIFVTIVGILAAMCVILRWWNVEITDFPTMVFAVLGVVIIGGYMLGNYISLRRLWHCILILRRALRK